LTRLFVDTGFLIALEAADDLHHAAAIRMQVRVATD
jgi:predicted nucleic acid-binding protein